MVNTEQTFTDLCVHYSFEHANKFGCSSNIFDREEEIERVNYAHEQIYKHHPWLREELEKCIKEGIQECETYGIDYPFKTNFD